jgi:hypothetical protein
MITEGRKGKIQIRNCSSTARTRYTIAEMGKWQIQGFQRTMIEKVAFQDTIKKFYPSQLTPGGLSFDGYWDPSSTMHRKLIKSLSSGTYIQNSTVAGVLSQLRVWNNSDTTLTGFGYWSATGYDSSGRIYITSIDFGQDKGGLGTISIKGTITNGLLSWSTVTP